jgi:hypothetical protein
MARWQNLVHKKCPHCDAKMLREPKVFACPDCDYYITPAKLIAFITDKTSVTWQHMSAHEREIVENGMRQLGIVVE